MFKKLALIGALCIGLMVLGGGDANAYPPRLSGWSWTPGSIVFNSTWLGAANFVNNPTDYSVTLIPDLIEEPLIVFFRNYGGGTGGVSVNFNNINLTTEGGNVLDPSTLKGNGKINSSIAFDDCPGIDDPMGVCEIGEGKLWLLWFDEANKEGFACDDTSNNPEELDKINCVKEYLSFMYAPNPGWVPYAISTINKFDAVVEAYTDVNKDGPPLDEVVHGDFYDCELNATGDEYVCGSVSIWSYKNNDPTGYCEKNDLINHEPVCP
jgi:hypothetical protein